MSFVREVDESLETVEGLILESFSIRTLPPLLVQLLDLPLLNFLRMNAILSTHPFLKITLQRAPPALWVLGPNIELKILNLVLVRLALHRILVADNLPQLLVCDYGLPTEFLPAFFTGTRALSAIRCVSVFAAVLKPILRCARGYLWVLPEAKSLESLATWPVVVCLEEARLLDGVCFFAGAAFSGW